MGFVYGFRGLVHYPGKKHGNARATIVLEKYVKVLHSDLLFIFHERVKKSYRYNKVLKLNQIVEQKKIICEKNSPAFSESNRESPFTDFRGLLAIFCGGIFFTAL